MRRGTGGFFKAHKDTPRSANMFGSLVIVFPTNHAGGELILRHGGKEWTFDSANELAMAAEPSIGYVAFFSDVEHEVAVVQSGYRVTLTYNLYFGETPAPPNALINLDVNHEYIFKSGLEQLLADPKFLPKGGLIGFGLQHEYPVNAATKLRAVLERLKGSDALVKKVCDQLSLPIQPKILTKTDDYYGDDDVSEDSDENEETDEANAWSTDTDDPNVLAVLTDHVVDLSKLGEVQNASSELTDVKGVLILPYPSGRARWSLDIGTHEKVKDSVDIQWITEVTTYTNVKTEYIAFGNEASLGYLYGTVCLVAKIGPAGKRRVEPFRSPELWHI
ncbi:uncharacterized protein LOC129585501 isoform X2 [Paramacrobiotus metropolitanus]|uniref:uncharacterized protein LOC129585501 isoform X2 n=1 Tax=Paramacrobiotus metropolitanus TaxID=2943436 RepID=UPI0024465338|nr:uncharacterized protein LOC129585501 isoform X2 [Paramacrobiotus metropolitanus]